MALPTTRKLMLSSCLVNLFITAIKAAAAIFTHSSAVLAESVRSLGDTVNQFLLLANHRRSEKKTEAFHPFGFSLDSCFWPFFTAIFLYTAGAVFSILKGIDALARPPAIMHIPVALGILAFSILAEATTLRYAFRQIRRENGRTRVFAVLKQMKKHELIMLLWENLAALIGPGIALILLFARQQTSIRFLDGLASILIGITSALVSIRVGRETRSLLIGESADPKLLQQVYLLLRREENIQRIVHIRSLQFGSANILLAIKADFDVRLNNEQVSNLIQAIEGELRTTFPEIKKVHFDSDLRDPLRRPVPI